MNETPRQGRGSLKGQLSGEFMEEGISRVEAGKRADQANAHPIATIGIELMNAFNHGKTDPSDMAQMGHDTAMGYEFCVERNGVVYVVSVGRDWAT